MPAGNPKCFRFAECRGERSWFRARKAPVAVVQKYRYGLSEPCGSKNQVNGVISIDVARLHPQTAGGREKLNGLPPCCRQLKLNPVGAAAAAIMTSLNASEVQAMIAVKISKGDR